MVTEGPVVGMLGNGHELKGVVAGGRNAWNDMVGELPVGADLFDFLGHAHVGFVDQGWR